MHEPAEQERVDDPLVFAIASPADSPAVVALVESAYRGEPSRAGWTTEADLLDGQRTDAAAVAEAIAGPRTIVVLASRAAELLACCQLSDEGAGLAYFGMFAVRPDRQGSGVGRRLLAYAEDLAASRFGARRMRMSVIAQRAELVAWYERRGYRRTGERLPFPYGDERFGIPRRDDLEFVVLDKAIGPGAPL
ncbi:MAG: GNAT family N-acetyltransferase [Actinomycetota bacterium]|nr:GNAT family N-acetyltransferase [Actinomycetota bacterium]